MANLNRVFLIGNLTRDPELRYTPGGTAVANLRMAINRRFKDKAGELKQEVCYLTVVAWDKQAELCNQYLHKGSPLFVEGRLQSRTWDGPDGKKKSVVEIRAERIQFLGGPSARPTDAGSPAGSAAEPGETVGFPEEKAPAAGGLGSHDEVSWGAEAPEEIS